ncbi:PiT family inorganic phosphate transporter [Amycolatopsis echigonensis]|uniref:PiT family inorganic phosphate transporter n=2 Tax=Pseudonocardiaceae TaxID=2070 RepID=A0A2N3WJJ7_9PSEU|nr:MULTISPECIES: inorganic phosphate transporter [Pseudonocardiaceae]AEA23525.1 phosphate transporter [Pseudonocardia dioxanivorans CB1190]PKV94039.1 PiT family inorganic phosphate transporter [Amycolatopsis niigatensis]
MTVAILVGVLLLAGTNGANDVSKGVATLAGSGVTRYRTAVAWGALTTLLGSLAAVWLGTSMLTLFSSGIVAAAPTPEFALAVLAGVSVWVAAATLLRLPVSTTHAIVGALIGAGLLLDSKQVRWSALLTKVAIPLLASAAAAFAISAGVAVVARRIDAGARTRPAAAARLYGGVPFVPVTRVPPAILTSLHWLSAGAVSAARGLNDTPKLVAVGAFALVPAGMSIAGVTYLVAAAMCAGAVIVGIPVARRLGEGVVSLRHTEGLRANLVTALLVGMGGAAGLPMSTTHVSTGAIAGTSGTELTRLNTRTLRDFAVAWTVTPFVAALVAAGVYLLLR